MICTHPQLFIVIDPMLSTIGWEYDLTDSVKEYIQTRPSVKQEVIQVVGQTEVKKLFDTNQVKNDAVFLFTEASSDLVILTCRLAKLKSIQIFTVGFWRKTVASLVNVYKADDQQWWKDFDRTCFKALEKNILSDEFFKHNFIKTIAKKKYAFSIIKFPIPASVIKNRIQNIHPIEFKSDLIMIDVANYKPELKQMIGLLLSELKLENPASVVFVYENGTPTREQYVQWLMNAKVVINFDVQGRIGDDVYEYYAAKVLPLTNTPDFYVNIVPDEWRLQKEWVDTMGKFIDAQPVIQHKV